MSVEVIHCPDCRHQLRVPESLFGEPVTCPQCRVTFRAPSRQDDGTMGQPEMLTPTVAMTRRSKSASPLLFPGIALLFVSLMGAFSNGITVYLISTDPDKFFEPLLEAGKDPNHPLQKLFKDQGMTAEQMRERAPLVRDVSAFFLCFSAIGALGGLAMLLRRFYWLAILGNGVAMLNIAMGCCSIGLPTGIWGLVKLLDPDTRALFRK